MIQVVHLFGCLKISQGDPPNERRDSAAACAGFSPLAGSRHHPLNLLGSDARPALIPCPWEPAQRVSQVFFEVRVVFWAAPWHFRLVSLNRPAELADAVAASCAVSEWRSWLNVWLDMVTCRVVPRLN